MTSTKFFWYGVFFYKGSEDMLESIALIIFVSLLLASIARKVKVPPLIFMMITGILLGPYVFDVMDDKILAVSSELREIALIVILLRAGLTLDIEDLKKVGRPAFLLSFLPALLEIGLLALLGHLLFALPYTSAFLLATMVSAVSPAVIVPSMIALIEKKKGTRKQIPQMILASASIDDVVVIVLFSSMLLLAEGISPMLPMTIGVPLAVILGAVFGFLVGKILVIFFQMFHMRDTVKVLLLFGVAFTMMYVQELLEPSIFVSGLIAIMVLGMTIQKEYQVLSLRLRGKFSKLWVGAEIMLFVLVGALLDIHVLADVGLLAILFVFLGVLARMFGAFLSTSRSSLDIRERLFVMVSYTPKATVQAAIGGIPLALGFAYGQEMLAIAVLSIFLTAPIGAMLIDHLSKKVLD